MGLRLQLLSLTLNDCTGLNSTDAAGGNSGFGAAKTGSSSLARTFTCASLDNFFTSWSAGEVHPDEVSVESRLFCVSARRILSTPSDAFCSPPVLKGSSLGSSAELEEESVDLLLFLFFFIFFFFFVTFFLLLCDLLSPSLEDVDSAELQVKDLAWLSDVMLSLLLSELLDGSSWSFGVGGSLFFSVTGAADSRVLIGLCCFGAGGFGAFNVSSAACNTSHGLAIDASVAAFWGGVDLTGASGCVTLMGLATCGEGGGGRGDFGASHLAVTVIGGEATFLVTELSVFGDAEGTTFGAGGP